MCVPCNSNLINYNIYKYTCNYCDLHTNIKCNYDKHVLTKKHIQRLDLSTNNIDINNVLYKCEICLFESNKRSKLDIHMKTRKHLKNTGNISNITNPLSFICEACNKIYTKRNSFFYHKTTCKKKKLLLTINKDNDNNDNNDADKIKLENEILKKLLIDVLQGKKINI